MLLKGLRAHFLASCHQQGSPSRRHAGLFVWGQAPAVGHGRWGPRQAGALLASAGLDPTQGPRERIVRLPSGLPEERHFHLSAGTYLFPRPQGGAESHNARQLGTLQRELTGQRRKSKDRGTWNPFPSLASGETKQQRHAGQALCGARSHSLIHPFHKSLQAKHLQSVRVKREEQDTLLSLRSP